MQPLISPIDHESRSSSRCEERIENQARNENQALEATPLINRFPPPGEDETTYAVPIVPTLLLFVLIVGCAIGAYLLFVQIKTENILPPVDGPPLELVPRTQWDAHAPITGYMLKHPSEYVVSSVVVVVQTDTHFCDCYDHCVKLMKEMEVNRTAYFPEIVYSFVISRYGQVFEGLGWHSPSPFIRSYMKTGLVIAYIGWQISLPRLSKRRTSSSGTRSPVNADPAIALLNHIHGVWRLAGWINGR